ncbi:TIM barrel protein [Acidaminobacter hydrogenoformans]|uniref:Xylose isomerase-like TIM barrel domain-containing protein n=1 Tax=Acidaminobacter hydrogenoformans DSM 2784 TaxID=1120920 RepID=A0A1G5RUB5_9FIRM|nr:TIM barrel protein [Acidaminobacter hydrogenoformans]SCZ77683.1 hypothetical protein SAMN03080599_00881 [Acidaminobacter hydrogenoformans DSM 2784]
MSMILGATYDESAVSPERDRAALEILSEAGFRSLELALHARALGSERAWALETAGRTLGFSFAFHAPDFAEPGAFDLKYVMAEGGSLRAFGHWIDECGAFGNGVQLIFHGGVLESDTLRFVDWALNRIEKSRGNQILLLENTFSPEPDCVRFGQSHEALLKVLETFAGCRQLGLCLDTAHWLRSQNCGQFPYSGEDICVSSPCHGEGNTHAIRIPNALLPFINRIHLHSVSTKTGRDHQGMTAMDKATESLLSPWLKGSEPSATHDPKDCVFSIEVLASALDEKSWIETVLESGAWLGKTGVLALKNSLR